MVKIYYMSGTGNSLKIARDLCAGLGRYEPVSMPHLRKDTDKTRLEGEVIGFVFPVYFGRPPVFIQEFISNADFGKAEYIFAVANGGGLFGRTLQIIDRILRKRGLKLDAGFYVEMPGNYPYIGRLNGKSHERLLKRAPGRIKNIADAVMARRSGLPKRSFSVLESIYCLFAFDIPYDLSKRHVMDRHFWINDGCRNCGQCIDVCPVGNIYRTRWKPAWGHDCINCLACYHICPRRGIDLRCEWKMIELVPHEQKIFRYRHPDITAEDLINL